MTPRPSFFLGLVLALAGCGGNGGAGVTLVSTGSATFVPAKIPIGWAQRAREFAGPGSALSVVITIDNAGTSNQNITLEADRATAPGAYTQTYTTALPVQLGIESIHVRFYSQVGGLGNIVAQSDASVQVGSDGTLYRANGSALGSVQASGNIASVVISGPYQVTVDTPANITTTAYDNLQNAIAVSPGSISYQTSSGTGSATINSTGQLVGSTVGSVLLSATIDGVVSPSYGISVTLPPLTMSSISQATNGMILDVQTGHLWASVPATDTTNGNCVIEIDPVSQQIISRIAVGSNPTVMAISDDGSALYVGLQGSDSFARIDPVGKTLIATYPVNPNVAGVGNQSQYADFIAVEPGNPDVVAMSQHDVSDTGFVGGCIYYGGNLAPNQLGIYDGEVMGFSSPTTLWGSDPGFEPQTLFQASVNTGGSTLVNSNRGLGGTFSVFAGNLYFTNGQVVSGLTGNVNGTFPVAPETLGVTVDIPRNIAYYIAGTSGGDSLTVSSFNASSFTLNGTYPVPAGPTTAQGFTVLPSGGLAFEDGSRIYFLGAPSSRGARTVSLKKP